MQFFGNFILITGRCLTKEKFTLIDPSVSKTKAERRRK